MFYLEREITCGFLSGFSYLSWVSAGCFFFSVVLGWCEDLHPHAYLIKLIVKGLGSRRGLDSSDAQSSQPSVPVSGRDCTPWTGRVNQKAGWGEPLIIMFFSEDSPLVWADFRCRAVWNCILFLLLGKPHLEIKKKFNCKVQEKLRCCQENLHIFSYEFTDL